jgi:hypothetical protein
MAEVQILYSAGGQFYVVPEIRRECGIWLSVARYPLPVPNEWHRPGLTVAAVIRGRDYWRIGAHAPQYTDGSKAIDNEDELVRDYADAAWWAPGLQEAWAECQGMREAMYEANQQIEELSRMHVCEKAPAPLPSPLPSITLTSPLPQLSGRGTGQSGRGTEKKIRGKE